MRPLGHAPSVPETSADRRSADWRALLVPIRLREPLPNACNSTSSFASDGPIVHERFATAASSHGIVADSDGGQGATGAERDIRT